MKFLIFTLLLVSSVFQISAQDFKNLRYDENYSYLKDSSALSWYDKIKYARFNPSGRAYVSFGGEVRYQYFKYENEDWGEAIPDNDGYILSRFLLHADLHINNRIRLFSQLQSSVAAGRIDPSPVEQNELDLHQLFFDLQIIKNSQRSLTLRVGRQEMNYGSSRLISVREGPNNRQSFDGVKILFGHKRIKSDIFYSDYVISKTGIFNDKFANSKIRFGGIYTVLTNIPIIKNIDLYYLFVKREQASWSDVKGEETRHSVGTRIWGKSKRWQYDFEGIYQFGDIDANQISAWTISCNMSYALGNKMYSPSIGLKTELISGDKKMDDGRIESFNPLFPRGAYFGYAALIGPSNLVDIHPSISVPLNSNISISADYDVFWRYSTKDGIYSPSTSAIFPAGTSGEKFMGHQISGIIEFSNSKHVYVRGEITLFKPGSYITSMSVGKDILFTGITTAIKF